MSINAGGLSSKLGNRYEAYWLVRELLDVVTGTAEWLRFEGIATEFEGFEAAIRRDGRTEWHQTKINAPGGNWTIGALGRVGVLSAFAKRLKSGEENHCVFVSQSPARDLQEFGNKARLSIDPVEFRSALNQHELATIKLLEDAWGDDQSKTHAWLQRCWFRTASIEILDRAIETFSSLCFEHDELAFAVLRDHLEEQFNKPISTASAREAFRAPLGLKHWGLDTDLHERLSDETVAYLATFPVLAGGGEGVERKESKLVDELLAQEDGPTVVLVTGVAGSGKSGVVRGLIERLRARGVCHLAFRVDHYLTPRSPDELGKQLLRRYESPAVTLKGISETQRSVLIIDQVDAISEVSGRQGAVREAVLRLVDQITSLRTVRIILVCRSFDLDSDTRLKQLKGRSLVAEVKVPLLDWPSEVEPILTQRGLKGSTFSKRQRELLCLPLNLGLFLELHADAGTFASRSDLFERFLERKDRSIRASRAPSWSMRAALGCLVDWMSEQQKLNAPETILDKFSGALDALASEHLIVRARGAVNLFHESLFDHVFARHFANGSRSLHELLVASEQHLFRRTQTRQILEALRQTDRIRYRRELEEILTSPRVRYHIKQAVALWLASLPDPGTDELNVVLALDGGGSDLPRLVGTVLFGSVGWFDILVANGWLRKTLEEPHGTRPESVLRWLNVIAEDRPGQVACLLDGWWGGDPQRGQRLLSWFGFVKRGQADAQLQVLCERTIRACAATGSGDFLSRHDMVLSTWTGKRPEEAAGVLRALFDAWFDAHPGQHPFEREAVRALDVHDLSELAKKSPRAFLEGAGPALSRSVSMAIEKERSGNPDHTFLRPFRAGDQTGTDALIALYREALRRLAADQPSLAGPLMQQFDPKSHWFMLHLHLETIAASAGALGKEFYELIDLPGLFEAGWQGARWKSFADAARASLPTLSQTERAGVERRIFELRPELDAAIKLKGEIQELGEGPWRDRAMVLWWLSRSGHCRWAVLETIGETSISAAARNVLEEGRRKFRGEEVPVPSGVTGGWVQSPIPRDRATRMTDAQWLKAMEKHATDDGHPRRHVLEGGAWQLGSELEHATKSSPERFSASLPQIPEGINPAYPDRIISGLAEAENVRATVLADAVKLAHARSGCPHGSSIVRVFERHPKICELDVLDVLLWYGSNGVANDFPDVESKATEQELVTISDLIDRGGRLHFRGINSVRGSAAEALERVLWDLPALADPISDFIERRVELEQLYSVRCCLTRPLLPLFNIDRDKVARLMVALSERSAAMPPPESISGIADPWLARVGDASSNSPSAVPRRATPRCWAEAPQSPARICQRRVPTHRSLARNPC